MNIIGAIAAIVFVVFAQGYLFRRFALRHISYTREFSRSEAYEGERVKLVEVISNEKRLPVPWLLVESRISKNIEFKATLNEEGGAHSHRSLFYLSPKHRIIRRHDVLLLKRGLYTQSDVSLTSGDPLGLFHVGIEKAVDIRIAVYPSLIEPDEMPEEFTRFQGDILARRHLLPDLFLISGIREYREGDPTRLINWRASARMDELMVKELDFTAQPKLLLLLNVQFEEFGADMLGEYQQAFIERGVSLCATLAAWAYSQGIECAFLCNGGYDSERMRDIISPPSLSGMLEALSTLETERRVSFHAMLGELAERGISGRDIALITCHEGGTFLDTLAPLRAKNRVTILKIDKPKEAVR